MTSASVSLGYSPSFNFLGQTVYQKSFSKNVSLRMASVPNGNCLKGKCLRMATVRRASVSEWQVSEWQLSPNGNCRMASVPNGKCPKGKWRPALGVAKLTFCAPNTLVTAGVIFLLCDASGSSSLSNQTFILSGIISITARQAVSSEF